MGLALLIVVLKTIGLKNGDDRYRQAARLRGGGGTDRVLASKRDAYHIAV